MSTEIEKLAHRIEAIADEATTLDCAVYDVFGEEHFADMKRLASYVLRVAPAIESLREAHAAMHSDDIADDDLNLIDEVASLLNAAEVKQ